MTENIHSNHLNSNPIHSQQHPIQIDIDLNKIDYANPQDLLNLRKKKYEKSQDKFPGNSQTPLMDALPCRRVFEMKDIDYLINSKGINRLLLVIINISNRISKFGLLESDSQINYLKKSMNPRTEAVIKVLEQMEAWVKEIPLDEGAQRYGNKAFKKWGDRLEFEAEKLHEHLIDQHNQPIQAELIHHFKSSFGSFGRLDYGTGHELSFLAYLSILHVTRILQASDLLITGLIIFQRYINLCRSLQQIYNLEPAGSKGVYGLDDFFHGVYIFGSAQLLYHPTIKTSSILDEKFTQEINEIEKNLKLSKESKEFMIQHGLPQSIFFQSIKRTIDLKSTTVIRTKQKNTSIEDPQKKLTFSSKRIENQDENDRSEQNKGNQIKIDIADHSPILWNLGTNVKTWSKIHAGLIKMFKGEILSKVPVMQHFWMTDETGVLSWTSLDRVDDEQITQTDHPIESDEDVDYKNDYRFVADRPVLFAPPSSFSS